MTTLLDQAITEVMKLSPDQQEDFARWMLAELAEERRWQDSFDRSADLLGRLADEALADHRAGKTEALIPANL